MSRLTSAALLVVCLLLGATHCPLAATAAAASEVVAKSETGSGSYFVILKGLSAVGHWHHNLNSRPSLSSPEVDAHAQTLREEQLAIIEAVLGSASSDRLLYQYTHALHGFAAVLSAEDVATLRAMDSVLSVTPSKVNKKKLKKVAASSTTRSSEYEYNTSEHPASHGPATGSASGAQRRLLAEAAAAGDSSKALPESLGPAGGLATYLGLNSRKPTLYGKPFRGRGNSTDSWNKSFWSSTEAGKGTIIGIFDSGIWPESPELNPKGMPPPPKKWKGICQVGDQWPATTCNNKIIGARYYNKGFKAYLLEINETYVFGAKGKNYLSARDEIGIGTVSATVAAGSPVYNPRVGNPPVPLKGMLSGVAFNAHIAVYKVSWGGNQLPGASETAYVTYTEADILAALEDSIRDGIDVGSILNFDDPGNGRQPNELFPMEIGTLMASLSGIHMVMAAGVFEQSSSVQPWQTSATGCTYDVEFTTTLTLGSGLLLKGQALTSGIVSAPLIYAKYAVKSGANPDAARLCLPGTLDPTLVKGKIVLCDQGVYPRHLKGAQVAAAGGIGLVLAATRALSVEVQAVPAIMLPGADAELVKAYINGTAVASATITGYKPIAGVPGHPRLFTFALSGTNAFDPFLLKPDLVAPINGVLGGWTQSRFPILENGASLWQPPFPVFDTSNDAPPFIIAGLAAAVKSARPSWSPAMIRSALMTTAVTYNNLGLPITTWNNMTATPQQFGVGHPNARAALDPGLVFKLSTNDYLLYLCIRNHTVLYESMTNRTCPKNLPETTKDFNYPSITVAVCGNTMDECSAKAAPVTVTRTLTTVAKLKGEKYSASLMGFPAGQVTVSPSTLTFANSKSARAFRVTVVPVFPTDGEVGTPYWGKLLWTSKSHTVSVVVQFVCSTCEPFT